ncbi:hypothetical protein [Streptococcus lutetiensis]|uniref:hypothetical protein n=1 Tax=Streptococcus lutetiensis TaxID=150055 RepID=UPI0022E70FE5|nr:hypothetical protein [Streptococcus lutetiensis]
MRANLFAHYYEDTRKLSKQNLMAFTKASSLYQAKPSLKESSARVRIIVGEKKLRECLLQQGIYIIFYQTVAWKSKRVWLTVNMRLTS